MRGDTRVICILFFFIISALGASNYASASDQNGPKANANKTVACAALLTDAIPSVWVEKMLAEGKASDPATQRLRDIVQRSGFKSVALNQAIFKAHHDRYTFELEQGLPTDQKQSGRCWIFAGLNMLRSTMIAEGRVPRNFEFSENYLHFFNMLEKSNGYLETVISRTSAKGPKGAKLSKSELGSLFEPQIGDGGWFEYFQMLVSKYGLVPKSAMPETRSSENTALLLTELKHHLANTARLMLFEAMTLSKSKQKMSRKEYQARLREIKERGMSGIWKILATHLGDPPSQFEYRAEGARKREGAAYVTDTVVNEFTPREFADNFVRFEASDYVTITASPQFKPGVYEQKGSAIGPAEGSAPKFNVRFINTSVERLEQLAIASIEGGEPVWFAAAVTHDVDNASGIMHPKLFERDAVYNLGERERIEGMERDDATVMGLQQPEHAMLLTGFDRPDPNGPVVKFKNENSWGAQTGTNGTYHLYREWFQKYVYQVIVHKRFLSEKEQKAWAGKARKIDESDELFKP